MRSPFDDLGKPRLDNPKGEECEGVFSCQEPGCYARTSTARYVREAKVLTWKCDRGHISQIEGFEIE